MIASSMKLSVQFPLRVGLLGLYWDRGIGTQARVWRKWLLPGVGAVWGVCPRRGPGVFLWQEPRELPSHPRHVQGSEACYPWFWNSYWAILKLLTCLWLAPVPLIGHLITCDHLRTSTFHTTESGCALGISVDNGATWIVNLINPRSEVWHAKLVYNTTWLLTSWKPFLFDVWYNFARVDRVPC